MRKFRGFAIIFSLAATFFASVHAKDNEIDSLSLQHSRSLDYAYIDPETGRKNPGDRSCRIEIVKSYIRYLDSVPDKDYDDKVRDIAWHASNHCHIWLTPPGEPFLFLDDMHILSRFLRLSPKSDVHYVDALWRYAHCCLQEGQGLLAGYSLIRILDLDFLDINAKSREAWILSYKPNAEKDLIRWSALEHGMEDVITLKCLLILTRDEAIRNSIQEEIYKIKNQFSDQREVNEPLLSDLEALCRAGYGPDTSSKIDKVLGAIQRRVSLEAHLRKMKLNLDFDLKRLTIKKEGDLKK